MFEVLAEIGEPGSSATLTGQYPPLREILDVNQKEFERAMLDYSESVVEDQLGAHAVCLLVRVAPDMLAEVLYPARHFDGPTSGQA